VSNDALLKMSLGVAVPLRVAELELMTRGEVFAEMEARRDEWSELIASRADILLYGGGKKGDVARVHTALVNALAHLAFAPGGVEFMGMRFEARQEVTR
jgi:hypothetical protein